MYINYDKICGLVVTTNIGLCVKQIEMEDDQFGVMYNSTELS